MGSFLSKDQPKEEPVKAEEPIYKSGSKRPLSDENVSSENKKSKNQESKKKKNQSKKNNGNKKGGELQPRPEHLGPREARVPKAKVALLVGFNGAGYNGMQFNANVTTIESTLFEAMCKANAISKDNSDDPKKINWNRAARTDKGVSAAGNVISLKMQIPEEYDVIERINTFLPPQIRVWGYIPTIRSFHAKNLCDARIYEYLLPTCAFMEPAKRESTEERVNENDIEICDNSTDKFVKRYTARSTPEEIQARHNFRATSAQIEKFKDAMACYVGTHNFHNYTNRKPFKDKSANRYLISINVSDPIYIDGSEWLSIKLHGQSFMLHQIRKMISMGMLITRTDTPVSLIPKTFEEKKINIPKAPALGLLLERPIFRVYNTKLREKSESGRPPIDFDAYSDKIEDFKKEWIYKKIFEAENQEHVFDGYLTSLDAHSGPDFNYLNKEGIIPDECLVSAKYNSNTSKSDDEGEE